MKSPLQHRRTWVAITTIGAIVGLAATIEPERTPMHGPGKSAVPLSDFVNFESSHVHPIDKTPDGTKLLVVNTANNTLEVFAISTTGLLHSATIPVGVDPVTVRARSNNEAWVVNTVSDDISIVDLTLKATVRSVVTENEPADVVFAGSPQKAFVSCAEQEMIQVFDPANLATAPTAVLLKGEQPRALAVSPDGSTVYCAFFESGNQTTVIPGNQFHAGGFCSVQTGACSTIPNVVANPAGPYGGIVPVPNSGATGFNPPINPNNSVAPGNNSLVVRKNAAGQWMDANGRNWTNIVTGGLPNTLRVAGWDMPDRDVAMISANNPTTAGVTYKQTLGNILMAMAVHPSGEVHVIGTDATNEVRFEPNLRGKFLTVNVSRFTGAGSVTRSDLNPHINYTTHASAQADRKRSIGDPRGIAWKADGSKAYVTGMGSNNVITIGSTGARTVPEPIDVGEGPTGLVIDDARSRVYVLNKFDGSISTIDMTTDKEIARTAFFDPTPLVIKNGRKHLYNTHTGSGHGHISCGSCHVDGKWDRLAWDLGNPAGEMTSVTDAAGNRSFHPMKGLKTTQFLIDIINRGTGKLHWRGDKQTFHDFAGAFRDLQGTDAPLDAAGMQEFSDFLAATWYVPNPYRTYRPEVSVASTVERMNNPNRVRSTGTTFQTVPTAGVKLFVAVNVNCSHCHQTGSGRGHLPGNGSNSTNGQVVMTNNTNMVPDLRSVYRKNGFFYNTTECTSGFGMMSDGIMETLFNQTGTQHYLGDYEPELLSWSGGIDAVNSPASQTFDRVHPTQDAMPAVGLRHTLHGAVGSTAQLTTMKTLVNDKPAEYAMIVKGIWNGEQRGFYYLGSDNYQPDLNGATAVTHAQLVTAAQGGSSPLTWTIVHPNTKIRTGVDRDSDGTFDYTDGDAELDLTVFLEGATVANTMRTNLVTAGLLPTTDPYGLGGAASSTLLTRTAASKPVDWVLVQLRSAANSTVVIDEIPAMVQADGRLVMADGKAPLLFPDAPRGNYHVAVLHRNHLGAMTFSTQVLGAGVRSLNMSDPALVMYGSNARKVLGSIAALWAGDGNGDGILMYTGSGNDRDPVLFRVGGVVPTNTVGGYYPEDVNLDGVVMYTGSGNDRDIILQNIGGVIPTSTRMEQLP
ncbi:MAG: hypothetical protein JNM62_06985 [Flavobacteriales bacterium]|nr:hypothetical protein [Flavobacteriales bacterium]